MSALSDILALLDRWPAWKAITGLPERVAQLEQRVAQLEGKPAKATRPCPLCGAEMKVTKVEADPIFGEVGLQQHSLKCACGHAETRQVDPNKLSA